MGCSYLNLAVCSPGFGFAVQAECAAVTEGEQSTVEHPFPCVFSKEQHGKQHWLERIKHNTVSDGKKDTIQNVWVIGSSKRHILNLHPVTSNRSPLSLHKITRDKFSLYWFSELSHPFHEHVCASLLASFRKSRAHNLGQWEEIMKQSIFMLFHGRSAGTISVPPCPPTILFRWRPCCKRPQASAVSDLKGTDLGRRSRPGDLAIKLVIGKKYY